LIITIAFVVGENLCLSDLRGFTFETEGPRFRAVCIWSFSRASDIHPAGNGYSVLFRASERGEEEEWHPYSVTPLRVHVDSLTATGYG